MSTPTVELDLPLGNPEVDHLASLRQRHLLSLPGLDHLTAARLARAFPSLAAVYAAPEERLRALVGPVAAARIRWFLDAPLHSGAAPMPRRRGRGDWQHAA
jgi:ERCC4-type nuclease